MMTGRKRPRVLAVDDDTDFLEALRRMLSPRYDVVCLSDAGNLAEEAAALEPDLLILDFHMPGTDGVRALEILKSDPQTRHLPVLFLTGSRADEDFIKILPLGAEAFLNKPIGMRELHRRVQEALGVTVG